MIEGAVAPRMLSHGFFSNYPAQAIIDKIFAFIDKHNITPFIGASFKFSDIKQAIEAQEKGVDGKIIAVMDCFHK